MLGFDAISSLPISTLPSAVGSFTGTAALSVTQPSIAASGTITEVFTGTAALSVTAPSIAGTGTITVVFTGTAALSVTQPSIAASGTLQFLGSAALAVTQPTIAGTGTVAVTVTGTAALSVPQPSISAVGTGPATGAGGRPKHRKAVVHRYPPRRPRPFDPADLTVSELHSGSATASVVPPGIRASGTVTSAAEVAADDRLALSLIVEDEDLALALSVADTWL